MGKSTVGAVLPGEQACRGLFLMTLEWGWSRIRAPAGGDVREPIGCLAGRQLRSRLPVLSLERRYPRLLVICWQSPGRLHRIISLESR